MDQVVPLSLIVHPRGSMICVDFIVGGDGVGDEFNSQGYLEIKSLSLS